MTTRKWFFSFLKKYKWRLTVAFIFSGITSLLALVRPYVSGKLVDDVIKGNKRELLVPLIAIFISVTVVRSIFRYVYLYLFETSSQGILYSMRDHVYHRFLEQDFDFYNTHRTGDLMSRQTGDLDAVRHFIAYTCHCVFENLILFILAVVMIFKVNVILALSMIAVIPLGALTVYKQLTKVAPKFHAIRQRFSSLNTFVQENISGNRVVKAFAKEDFEIKKFNIENDGYRDAELDCTKVWQKYVPIFEFLSNLITIIMYLVGGILVIKEKITIGDLFVIGNLQWMLVAPLRQAGWLANDYQRFVTSIQKIYSTINVEPSIKQPEDPVVIQRLSGAISFHDVSYTIQDTPILKHINFDIKPGQTVGIIGPTGSGKSTLMNLLCRFYDVTEGEITVDGINLKNMDLFSLRNSIGMAMQDVFLFSDTIEGNIAYGNPQCSYEDVVEAAKTANAHSFIMEMPEEYDTIVGERGVGLSGGQKQRISLARALLKNPSILILDDTTSAVDMETETMIQEALHSLSEKHTVFVIAHRISSIKDADQILVLDNGQIIEHGNHDSLIAKKGYYYTVFKHQYGEFDSNISDTLQKGGMKIG